MVQFEPRQPAYGSLGLTGKNTTRTLRHPTVPWDLLELAGKSPGVPKEICLQEDTFLGPEPLP